MSTGTAEIIRADSRNLPLSDDSVDLIVTSPPYFALRSYTDGGEHYSGQLGEEHSPTAYLDALITITRECMRVLKPSGSLWINLGDKYSQRTQQRRSSHQPGIFPDKFEEFSETWAERAKAGAVRMPHHNVTDQATGRYAPEKSLIGVPWRYALRCVDELGLILRAEVIWSKPNGLPESVIDRVRRSHEQWFHFTLQPRYFSALDEIREPHLQPLTAAEMGKRARAPKSTLMHGTAYGVARGSNQSDADDSEFSPSNPLGKLPGSVWTVATEPFTAPDELGIEHYAAFPTEWPRRLIAGWSPVGICSECGQGRRPATTVARGHVDYSVSQRRATERVDATGGAISGGTLHSTLGHQTTRAIAGYICACTPFTDHRRPTNPPRTGNRLNVDPGNSPRDFDSTPSSPVREYHLDRWEPAATTPAVVLDPFGGTGTTALVAKALGRHGISVDMSADYCRLAEWRTNDPVELAKAARVPRPVRIPDTQLTFADLEVSA